MKEKWLTCHDYYDLNGNIKINVWFWLIMSNIQHLYWLLVMCFGPKDVCRSFASFYWKELVYVVNMICGVFAINIENHS
jgi:hypothetical protein